MGHFARVNDFNDLSGRVRHILRIMPRLLSLYRPQAWHLPLSRKGVLRFYWERLWAVGLVTRTGRKGDAVRVVCEVFVGGVGVGGTSRINGTSRLNNQIQMIYKQEHFSRK
jgi:hypothetical protein